MRLLLTLIFTGVFVTMVASTLWAASITGIRASLPQFGANPWALATLYDAYCGFLTFYVWVAYKERRLWSRILWFLLIMGLGNIAMSMYVLKELFKLNVREPAWKVLQRCDT